MQLIIDLHPCEKGRENTKILLSEFLKRIENDGFGLYDPHEELVKESKRREGFEANESFAEMVCRKERTLLIVDVEDKVYWFERTYFIATCVFGGKAIRPMSVDAALDNYDPLIWKKSEATLHRLYGEEFIAYRKSIGLPPELD